MYYFMQFPFCQLETLVLWKRGEFEKLKKSAALFPFLSPLDESYLSDSRGPGSPNTCSFTTQFGTNTPQLPLWLSQVLFTPSRPPCSQRRADIYGYISSYVCSSQFVKRLHNTACPHSRLATCVLICRPNRLVIQFKAKIITPPAQHCLPPLVLQVLNCIRWNRGEVHCERLTLPPPLSGRNIAAVQRIRHEKKSRSYLGSESSWWQFCSGCALIIWSFAPRWPLRPALCASTACFGKQRPGGRVWTLAEWGFTRTTGGNRLPLSWASSKSGFEIWTRNDRKMSSQRSLKISERDITDGGCHGPMQRASVLQDSVTGYETKFAYPTKMTSLTIKIKGGKKTLSDFTARQICIMCFQASPSLRRRWKTVKGEPQSACSAYSSGLHLYAAQMRCTRVITWRHKQTGVNTAFVISLHFF